MPDQESDRPTPAQVLADIAAAADDVTAAQDRYQELVRISWTTALEGAGLPDLYARLVTAAALLAPLEQQTFGVQARISDHLGSMAAAIARRLSDAGVPVPGVEAAVKSWKDAQ